MNARLFLLPVALFALSVAGCDSGPNPELSGRQASPSAPTANLLIPIVGPDHLAYSCPQEYSIDRNDGTFSLVSGPGTVGLTYYGIASHSYVQVTRNPGSTANIVIGYQSGEEGRRVTKTIGFMVGCDS